MVRSVKRGACQDKRSGRGWAELCYSCWCFIGVHTKSPNLQVYCRGGWDHYSKSTAWGKRVEDPGKQSMLQKKKTASKMLGPIHLWLLPPGGITLGKPVFITDALQTACKSASLQHLIFPCWNCPTLIHFSLGYWRQLMLVENFGICKREWDYITGIYDENLSRQSPLQDTTLKTSSSSLLFSKDLCFHCRSNKIL